MNTCLGRVISPTSAVPYLWQLTLGDDWSFLYSYTNPDGSPVNLAGAQPQAALFARDNLKPVLSMVDASSGVAIVDAANGKAAFSVSRSLTASLKAGGVEVGYPTRIQVMLLDSLGKLKTYKVDPIQAFDPRFQLIGPIPAGPAPAPAPSAPSS